jgi:predicted nucleic acid-binding protein
MINVLLDTNCFVALLDSSDKWNKTSVDILTELQKNDINLLITDIVLNEAINVICKRLENKGRSDEMKEFLGLIEKQYPAETILWISADIKIYHSKIIWLVSENKGLLNYNDCFLLAYMLKNKIKNIISFDNDFDQITGINRIDNKIFQLI